MYILQFNLQQAGKHISLNNFFIGKAVQRTQKLVTDKQNRWTRLNKINLYLTFIPTPALKPVNINTKLKGETTLLGKCQQLL
jgi:hypothetical protein